MTTVVWRACTACKGKGTVPDRNNGGVTQTCTACKGKGGADTMTTP